MNKITINKQELELLMESAKSAISISDERPMLTYIKIEVTKSHIISVTLDGYRLAKLEIPHEQEVEPFDCYIKPFPITKDLQTVDIKKTNRGVNVILNCLRHTLTYDFIQPQGDFLDYARVMPQVDTVLQTTFNAKLLIAALKPFCKTSDRYCHVRLSFVRSGTGISKVAPVLLSHHNSEAHIDAIVSSIREG
jgi:DNA polymerase III sliding clamp (beta) subunit (PCNA family)